MNAKSSTAVRPVATVVTAPAVPCGPVAMRSRVPLSVLLTQTAPSCTLMPFALSPELLVLFGSRSVPWAHRDAVPVLSDTFHTVPAVESVAYKASSPLSSARPLRTFTPGMATT